MRKAKQQEVIHLTFKEYLEKYEPVVLNGAILQISGSVGWELLKAFLVQRQREFEIASLDLVGHTGKENEAAKASGYAQACEDVAEQFMQELTDIAAGRTGLVEGAVREEI